MVFHKTSRRGDPRALPARPLSELVGDRWGAVPDLRSSITLAEVGVNGLTVQHLGPEETPRLPDEC